MLLALALQAHALDCEEITNMVAVNVPVAVVVQTIEDAGSVAPGTLVCVRAGGAPVEVIAAIERSTEDDGAPTREPARPTRPAPAADIPPPPAAVVGLSARRTARILLTSDAPGAEYYLAKALDELGLLHSAERSYALAYTRHDAWSEAALVGLAAVAERTGDWEEVDAILAEATTVPAGLRSRRYLVEGLRHARARHRQAAREALLRVSEASSSYRAAQLAYGVVVSWGCIRRSVLRAFAEAATGDDALADLARLDTARASGAIGRNAEAGRLYDLVAPSSPYYARAQLEAAWSDFTLGDDRAALARLSRSGAIPRDGAPPAAFEPGVPVLAALILGDHCEYAAARHVLDAFDTWAASPGALRRPNGEGARVAAHLADLDAERARLRGPFKRLAPQLGEERARLERRAAESARAEQQWAEGRLAEEVEQARIVRAELDRSERAAERLLRSGVCGPSAPRGP